MFYEIKNYISDDGIQIREHIPNNETGDPTIPRFLGMTYISIEGDPKPIRVEFPKDYELEQCFAEYRNFADKSVADVLQQIKEQSDNPSTTKEEEDTDQA